MTASLQLLHAGTPLIVSQTTLSIMFVVLGIIAIGMGYGVIIKSKEYLLLHRWSMTFAVIITSAVIFLVMLPSVFNFYVDPDLQPFSSLSILTALHAVIGMPAITLSVLYAFGDLPKKVKYWMRLTALFWVLNLVIGVILFLDMLGLLAVAM